MSDKTHVREVVPTESYSFSLNVFKKVPSRVPTRETIVLKHVIILRKWLDYILSYKSSSIVKIMRWPTSFVVLSVYYLCRNYILSRGCETIRETKHVGGEKIKRNYKFIWYFWISAIWLKMLYLEVPRIVVKQIKIEYGFKFFLKEERASLYTSALWENLYFVSSLERNSDLSRSWFWFLASAFDFATAPRFTCCV